MVPVRLFTGRDGNACTCTWVCETLLPDRTGTTGALCRVATAANVGDRRSNFLVCFVALFGLFSLVHLGVLSFFCFVFCWFCFFFLLVC